MKDILFFFLISISIGAFPEVEVANFGGTYNIDKGNAFAKTWNLPERSRESDISFQVFKEESQFRFLSSSEEFLWENAPEFLMTLESLDWKNANFKSGQGSLKASVSEFSGSHPQGNVKLKQLDIGCQAKNKSILHDGIQSCIDQGRLTLSSFESTSQSKGAVTKFVQKAFSTSDLKPSAQSKVKLENLDLKINRGAFNLSVRTHLDIRLNIKANGSLKFTPGTTPESGELEMKLDKVRAGFLNVTGKVFEELGNINNSNIRVARPFIYINFP